MMIKADEEELDYVELKKNEEEEKQAVFQAMKLDVSVICPDFMCPV